MKRGLCLFAVAPFLLGGGSAFAAGINLGWNDCPGGPSYALTRTFACDTNAGEVHTLVGSFVAPAGVLAMSSNEAVIEIMSDVESLPDWWGMRAFTLPGCRAGSLSGNSDFTGGPFTCYDYWQDGSGGISMGPSLFQSGLNRAQIRVLTQVLAVDPRITSVPEGTEVYSFKAIIDNARTTGLGACGGCTDEVCIVLQSIMLGQPPKTPGGNMLLNVPVTAQHVIWQAWTPTDPRAQCPAVTPARNRTWGAIKTLYR